MKKVVYLIFSAVLFFFSSIVLAQDTTEVHLLGGKFSAYMNLTDAQKTKIEPVVAEIKNIMKAEKEKMDAMRTKRESGEQLDREEMMKLREQREKDISTIKSDIEKIKAELTPEQLEKFSNVKLPNLEMRRRGKS